MTLQEVKDQTAKEHGYKGYKELVNSTNIPPEALEWYYNRVTEIYARSKWDEACEAQKEMIWNDLKVHVTTPKNVFGDVVSATRIVRATYDLAPKPEFKP